MAFSVEIQARPRPGAERALHRDEKGNSVYKEPGLNQGHDESNHDQHETPASSFVGQQEFGCREDLPRIVKSGVCCGFRCSPLLGQSKLGVAHRETFTINFKPPTSKSILSIALSPAQLPMTQCVVDRRATYQGNCTVSVHDLTLMISPYTHFELLVLELLVVQLGIVTLVVEGQ